MIFFTLYKHKTSRKKSQSRVAKIHGKMKRRFMEEEGEIRQGCCFTAGKPDETERKTEKP